MMEICDFWPDAKIPTVSGRPAITAASVFESDIDAEASIGVVSNFGAGRAGSFIVAALAIEKLRAAEIPNIRDLAVLVRNQRPGAIETFPQYVFSHIIPLTYSLKHVMSATLKAKVEKLISQLEQFAFEKMTEDDDDEEEDATD
uniref:Tyrosine-protein phosphatase domain-containing protein n=2 Tax=Caenorhabditis japonica TaxID=281687 RepID=A0A8R1IBQ8_CAEJA